MEANDCDHVLLSQLFSKYLFGIEIETTLAQKVKPTRTISILRPRYPSLPGVEGTPFAPARNTRARYPSRAGNRSKYNRFDASREI